MTNEVKSLIEVKLKKVLDDIEEAVFIGVNESMSPNSLDYPDELDARWNEAMDAVQAIIDTQR